MHFARKRQLPPKKPCAGVKYPRKPESKRAGEETRAAVALKDVQTWERQLREIRGRLEALRFELEGGCVW
jgi:hypothetical protein